MIRVAIGIALLGASRRCSVHDIDGCRLNMKWNLPSQLRGVDRKSASAILRFTMSSMFIATWCLFVRAMTGEFIDPVPMLLLAAAVTVVFAVKLGERPGGASLSRIDEAAAMVVLAGIVRVVGAGLS
jgi:hypothetical protein